MKVQSILFFLTLAMITVISYSCGDDETTDPVTDCSVERSYASDVVPIITQTCAVENCHTTGASIGDYTTYADLKEQDTRGLLKVQIESGAMPKEGTTGPEELTDAQKETFLCWIEQGALDN